MLDFIGSIFVFLGSVFFDFILPASGIIIICNRSLNRIDDSTTGKIVLRILRNILCAVYILICIIDIAEEYFVDIPSFDVVFCILVAGFLVLAIAMFITYKILKKNQKS